jgi:hypothetical protein
MHHWSSFFQRIFLINLPERTDRLLIASAELDKYAIPFEVFPAIKHDSGVEGLRLTMEELLRMCLKKDYDSVLIFEDDVRFVENPNYFMDSAIGQLKEQRKWDLLYLGVNTHVPFPRFIDTNLLPVEKAYAMHAVGLSFNGMYKTYEAIVNNPGVPTDVCVAKEVQEQGYCFCTYPLLATQRNNYSDIDKKEVTYDYIETRFRDNIKHLVNE